MRAAAGAASGGAATGGAGASSAAPASITGRVVIGVDFGSSASGIAFGYPPASAEYDLRTAALHIKGMDRKVPTALLLDTDLNVLEFGERAEPEFQDRVSLGTPCMLAQSFKMALKPPADDGARTTKLGVTMVNVLHSNGSKVPVPLKTLITRALDCLRATAIAALAEQATEHATMKRRWVLTVPAIWDDAAKGFMKECAAAAGMVESPDSDDLLIALEPECALLTAMSAVGPADAAAISAVGAATLVLDAGGGTFDFANDRVVDVKPTFRFSQETAAGGHAKGALDVDEAFREFLHAIIGADEMKLAGSVAEGEVVKTWCTEKMLITRERVVGAATAAAAGSAAVAAGATAAGAATGGAASTAAPPVKFVTIQLGPIFDALIDHDDFNATDVNRRVEKYNELLKLELAAAEVPDVDTYCISFRSRNKAVVIPWRTCHYKFFKQTVDELEETTTAALKDIQAAAVPMPVRCVIVGGFSESTYVRDQLKAAAAAFGVTSVMPDRPALAVMRGAVLCGLQPEGPIPPPPPFDCILKKTYAYLGVELYNEKVHHKDMIYKHMAGEPQALVLIPLAQKGDRVAANDEVVTDELVRSQSTQVKVDFRLYAINQRIPECKPTCTERRWTVLQDGITSTGDNPALKPDEYACMVTVPCAGVDAFSCKLKLRFGGADIRVRAVEERTGKTVEAALTY